ncbi:GTPase RsgA [Streptomyces eurocidicus]|uniref:Small ribosomal subunit biogenesis GTPase RsgA n=1 Tax=Streptomyces eurocidicus TaxID=66423 RepID=A0A2N8NUN3_STREU|nr:ribosome small subunit-dependent GTPase A [Streptomyces eurocidicus]MBB5121335.1 ribosome biogenesis GTPase [Streptomyces eurocidicus]MBF6055939.1 ribosome small subunit-dependent GTPase A [Streptomyces eurocidicus]PNE32481.1 GTPase RsgA [Streptomyces eurocidicus]
MSFPSFPPLPSPSTLSAPSHPLSGHGWDADWAAEFAPYAERGLTPGRIARVDRGRCDLVVPDGDTVRTVHADTGLVTTGDPQRIMCTGDWAAADLAQGFVRALLPRRTAFVRSTSSKRSEAQILAANVTHAVIAVSLAVELDLGRVERFLTLAWESGAAPLVVLTKADLVADPVVLGHLLDDTAVVAPGAQVLAVSAATGEGVDVLAAALSGGTAVLLGQSGAGKSTLANALAGADVQNVHATRDSDGKGRHTTTTRNLLTMRGGGVLIDTPGLRGVGLWDADGGVARTFAEIDALARECRFHDCAHGGEPGCAVLAALDSGELPERRLDSYRKLIRENEWIAARTDARLRAEIRRDWKRKQAVGRHMAERKRGSAR